MTEPTRTEIEQLGRRLLTPAWCYDESGQQFEYVTVEDGKLAEQVCRLALQLMDERDQKIETTGGAEARIVSIQTDDEAWIKLLNERNQRVIESMK